MNTDYLSDHTHFLRTPARTQTCPCGPDGVIFLRTQTASSLRVVDFPDRQNLYHSPKSALCNGGGDYNPKVLATLIEKRQRWHLVQTRFYSAISDQNRYQINAKILSLQSFLMNRDDCKTTARISVYDESDPGRELGMDIRMARHLIHLSLDEQMDVALMFLHDQDFAEVASKLLWRFQKVTLLTIRDA